LRHRARVQDLAHQKFEMNFHNTFYEVIGWACWCDWYMLVQFPHSYPAELRVEVFVAKSYGLYFRISAQILFLIFWALLCPDLFMHCHIHCCVLMMIVSCRSRSGSSHKGSSRHVCASSENHQYDPIELELLFLP
jgi:hypothetical protein